jgi:acyl-coenzyme A synthetase/AMP-(fatty) acid ligase
VPNYEAQIVDDSGLAVAKGEIGNLWVQGQSAFAAYWNKPELTERAQRGDWVVTGDKFFRDPDGFYHYCGRSDDMLKVAGMWVSPGEVENALLSHADVAEAALVGATDGAGLTKLVSFVVLRPGAAPDGALAEGIRVHLRLVLPSYKCPQEIQFLQELPKTPTGKIQRFRLRELLVR